MLIRPIKCRHFCNLVKEGDEAHLISAIVDCVFSIVDVEGWNLRERGNRRPYIDAVRRYMTDNPLIVRDVMMTGEPYWFRWYDAEKDKRGKTKKISVEIVAGRLEDREKDVSL